MLISYTLHSSLPTSWHQSRLNLPDASAHNVCNLMLASLHTTTCIFAVLALQSHVSMYTRGGRAPGSLPLPGPTSASISKHPAKAAPAQPPGLCCPRLQVLGRCSSRSQ